MPKLNNAFRQAVETVGENIAQKAFEAGKANAFKEQFNGLTEREMLNKATNIIKSKFAGKVIGIDNKMFVNGTGASE